VLREGDGDVWVFVPFTRKWCVPRFFDALAASDVPFDRCKVTFYIDSEDSSLAHAVAGRAVQIPFADIVIHFSCLAPPGEKAKSHIRRKRHAAMRCASVGLMPKDCEYVLLLEDDTPPPSDCWAKLTAGIDAGYDWVSGFEVGRWGHTVPGIWRIDANHCSTATPGDGLEQVDATGIFLTLTTPEVYASEKWDVWDNSYGHDVSITYRMTLAGYRLAVDWSLTCVHMTLDKDYTTDMAVAWTRNVNGHHPVLLESPNVVPLSDFQQEGPKVRRHAYINASGHRPNPRKERSARRKS